MAETNKLDVSVEDSGGLERRMTVRLAAAPIEREVDTRLKAVGKKAKLKGFRPGKAPRKIIKQRYGQEVRQEVLSDVISQTYSQAINEQALRPAGGPSIQALPGADSNQFAYMAVFEVYPEIELASLGSLTIETPNVEIGSADVDDMIEKLRIQRAEWETVERKSADGDRVVVDFVGSIDGEPFPGGEGKDVTITLGDGQVIADFEKALSGVAAGEEKSAKVKFPKDYPNGDLAGKKAVFEITTHRVEERVLPEVDDEFLTAFGIEDGGIDELKEQVLSNMKRELDERIRAVTKERTLNALLDANDIEIPKSLVGDEIRTLQAEAMRRMGSGDPAHAPPPEQFEELARRRVSLGLLVERLIAENDIALDRDRVDERIQELSSPYDKPEEAAQVYRTSKDLMAQVESTVLEDQVVDYVLDHAKNKRKKLGFNEFMNT